MELSTSCFSEWCKNWYKNGYAVGVYIDDKHRIADFLFEDKMYNNINTYNLCYVKRDGNLLLAKVKDLG